MNRLQLLTDEMDIFYLVYQYFGFQLTDQK